MRAAASFPDLCAGIGEHVGPPFLGCGLLRMRPRAAFDCLTRPQHGGHQPPDIGKTSIEDDEVRRWSGHWYFAATHAGVISRHPTARLSDCGASRRFEGSSAMLRVWPPPPPQTDRVGPSRQRRGFGPAAPITATALSAEKTEPKTA